MRTEGQIRQQLKQVLFRHLQRELRQNFKRCPEGCQHNRIRYLGGEQGLGICGLDPKQLLICDQKLGGDIQAQTCPKWQALRSKEQIKTEFRALIASGDRGRIAARYPDVVAMMWVLDDMSLTDEIRTVEEQFDLAEVQELTDQGLWKKGTES
jgi:hypothetical protein